MGIKGVQDINMRDERLGEERLNNQGCSMIIVEYNDSSDIIVQFQDEYQAEVRATYRDFKDGEIKNPYFPNIFGGKIGTKYSSKRNGKMAKEYETWLDMLQRCYSNKYKEKHPTYQTTTCCEEWLNYENFYEWLRSQENFDKWLNGKCWALDKDILIKGNKIYSPETCLLVPHIVNGLFAKSNAKRGEYPIGVYKHGNRYCAQCKNPFLNNKIRYIGSYLMPEKAFEAYKSYKENLIKQVARIEYDNNNIVKECFDAMMNYKVEIND